MGRKKDLLGPTLINPKVAVCTASQRDRENAQKRATKLPPNGANQD
jgi:hypothetical protein